MGNIIIPVFAILAGLVFMTILRRKDERILIDERIQMINEKASTMTMRLCALMILNMIFGTYYKRKYGG